jgi:hypothetical protein
MSDSKHLGTKEHERKNSHRGSARMTPKEREMQRLNSQKDDKAAPQRQNSMRGGGTDHADKHHDQHGSHRGHGHHGEQKELETNLDNITEAEGLRCNFIHSKIQLQL